MESEKFQTFTFKTYTMDTVNGICDILALQQLSEPLFNIKCYIDYKINGTFSCPHAIPLGLHPDQQDSSRAINKYT